MNSVTAELLGGRVCERADTGHAGGDQPALPAARRAGAPGTIVVCDFDPASPTCLALPALGYTYIAEYESWLPGEMLRQ